MTRQIIGTARCDRRQFYQRSAFSYVHGADRNACWRACQNT